MHCSKHGTEYVSVDDCLPVCLEMMIGGMSISWLVLRSATMKMKKVGVTSKVTEETKQPFHNLKVIFNKEPIASLEQVQHFLECQCH